MKCQTILLKKFFGLKGAVYYEAIAMVIFSHVKITCEDNMLFSHVKRSSCRAKAHLVFHWCLYNKDNYLTSLFNIGCRGAIGKSLTLHARRRSVIRLLPWKLSFYCFFGLFFFFLKTYFHFLTDFKYTGRLIASSLSHARKISFPRNSVENSYRDPVSEKLLPV